MKKQDWQPLVSIIIPVYNGANFVAEAIESALAQTYTNIEIVVVNDGTTDNGETDKAISPYLDKIKYFKKNNGGVSSALNFGIKQMKGDYFSWLSHDDLYTPNKIEDSIKAIEMAGKNAIVMCQSDFVDAKSEHIGRPNINKKTWPLNSNLSTREILSVVFAGTSIGGCSLLIPKTAFVKAGLFNESYRYMQDMDMWYRMFFEGYTLWCISSLGVHSRVHGNQLTVTGNNIGRRDAQEIGRNLINRLISLKENELLKRYALLCYRNGMTDNGKYIVSYLKKEKSISLKNRITIFKYKSYGMLRPILRSAYYKVLYNVKLRNP